MNSIWTITVTELWLGRWAYYATRGIEYHWGQVTANDEEHAISCVENKHNIKNGV